MGKIIKIGNSHTEVQITHMKRSLFYFADFLFPGKLKPYQKEALATAMCLDCGFEYGSINCQGCEFYRREK